MVSVPYDPFWAPTDRPTDVHVPLLTAAVPTPYFPTELTLLAASVPPVSARVAESVPFGAMST